MENYFTTELLKHGSPRRLPWAGPWAWGPGEKARFQTRGQPGGGGPWDSVWASARAGCNQACAMEPGSGDQAKPVERFCALIDSLRQCFPNF